ncbi:hypothetical protein DMW99_11125 [Pseudomonas chlororaphis]|nr:hypothetical protein C1Y36_09855 [Pseudomonas sp. FW306-2-2C-D06C]PYC38072.1 hypothetical protein DMW99_11125 [Pseudomonas chlororaphis]
MGPYVDQSQQVLEIAPRLASNLPGYGDISFDGEAVVRYWAVGGGGGSKRLAWPFVMQLKRYMRSEYRLQGGEASLECVLGKIAQ